MKIIILGVGLVGKAVALDLAADKNFQVSAVDLRREALEELKEKGLKSVELRDLSQPEEVKKGIRSFDLVINAVPGFLGFSVLRACLEAKKNVIDITFSPEDPLELDELAQKAGVTAVVDCGVAPGLSNILAGHGLKEMDRGKSLTIYVGGLPSVRTWPFEYKTVFSPSDVIEEYWRPARYKENGQLRVKPALAEPELIEFENIGTLEAFLTDGLRTMLKTLPFPEMKEKTLRYPGHREKMALFREAGFFDDEPIIINGAQISPREMTTRILFSRLKLKPGEEDLTVMRVVVEGEKDGQSLVLTFDLLDRFDPKTGIHSMARTTGYTATMIARALAKGLIKKKGVIAPEILGFDIEFFQFVIQGLRERGIRVESKRSRPLNLLSR